MSVEEPSIIKIGSRTVDILGENNWVGINVVEAGVKKAYLLSENYLGNLSNPMTADIVVNYMARVQTQYGVRMRAGYCVDLDSLANGEVIFDAVATYADWTFGQKTVSLDERFPQIDATRADLDSQLLAKLKSAGKYFEEVFNRIFQVDLLHELKQLQHPEWAIKILKAYGAPSGLSMEEVFPDYPVGA